MAMATNQNTPPPSERHLSIAPHIELNDITEIAQNLPMNGEPEQPQDVRLRLDRRAVNLLIALAQHDQTNPAEQIRAATAFYLSKRLGDQAVQDFITEQDRQIRQLLDVYEVDQPNNGSGE